MEGQGTQEMEVEKAVRAETGASSSLPGVDLCVITSPRRPATLAATLQSLAEADPTWSAVASATILLDSVDPAVAGPPPPGFQLRPLTAREAAARAAYTPHQRCATAHWRALTHNLRARRDLLVFEDDVLFTSRWHQKLQTAVAFIKEKATPRFILALYSCHPWDTAIPLRIYDEFPYYGLQGMYYSASVRPFLARVIHDHSIVNPRLMHCDLAVKGAVETFEIPLFVLTRPLVQHVGVVSHNISGGFRQSPNFLP